LACFKLAEAVFFFLVGAGAIHFIHRDLGDSAVRLAERLRIDPDGRLVSYVIDHLDAITAQRLKQIGVATFFYAALRVTEGVGLVMEQVWAEYLTVGVTTAFLPWELYEIARHADWVRVCLLLANLVVLAYLVWWLGRSRRTDTAADGLIWAGVSAGDFRFCFAIGTLGGAQGGVCGGNHRVKHYI
jgi:uncharacterized membrane protein (DUF2068 family)